MTERRYMPLEDFVDFGYLQELNRQFLHPLGLALEVRRHGDGTVELAGVWDARDDPEGIVFDPAPDLDKAARVGGDFLARSLIRSAALGYIVQPVPGLDA